ncbi:MAG: TetR/AcrR family transcriptional regulator [Micromonosporaceae bacterium]
MEPRERLLEAGIRLLEEVGPEALQARKLAAEIGASTMAVYTHFGGMRGLLDAITQEAFVRFGQRLAEVPRTDDPVADLCALGLAYREYALANPQRYRLMFGATAPGTGARIEHNLTVDRTPTGIPELDATFTPLVEVVRRAMTAGRLTDGDDVQVAGQIWSATHGYVLLEIAGVFGSDDSGVFSILAPLTINLLVGLGDQPEAVQGSMMAAAEAYHP